MSTLRWMVALLAIALFPGPAGAKKASLEGVVNINTATAAELELLPGIGPSKAEAILAYRRRHPFRTVAELGRVKGIGPKTVKRLRPNLVVRGPTTAGVTGDAGDGNAASGSASSPPAPLGPPCPDAVARSRAPSTTAAASAGRLSGVRAPARP